jgi:hypothetical protein
MLVDGKKSNFSFAFLGEEKLFKTSPSLLSKYFIETPSLFDARMIVFIIDVIDVSIPVPR